MTDLSTHPTRIAGAWLADFASALESNHVDAAIALFAPECYWRDLVAFTWNIRTQEGPEAIRARLPLVLLAPLKAHPRSATFLVPGDTITCFEVAIVAHGSKILTFAVEIVTSDAMDRLPEKFRASQVPPNAASTVPTHACSFAPKSAPGN